MAAFIANVFLIVVILLTFVYTSILMRIIKQHPGFTKQVQTILTALVLFCGVSANLWQINYFVKTPDKVKIADQKKMSQLSDTTIVYPEK